MCQTVHHASQQWPPNINTMLPIWRTSSASTPHACRIPSSVRTSQGPSHWLHTHVPFSSMADVSPRALPSKALQAQPVLAIIPIISSWRQRMAGAVLPSPPLLPSTVAGPLIRGVCLEVPSAAGEAAVLGGVARPSSTRLPAAQQVLKVSTSLPRALDASQQHPVYPATVWLVSALLSLQNQTSTLRHSRMAGSIPL